MIEEFKIRSLPFNVGRVFFFSKTNSNCRLVSVANYFCLLIFFLELVRLQCFNFSSATNLRQTNSLFL